MKATINDNESLVEYLRHFIFNKYQNLWSLEKSLGEALEIVKKYNQNKCKVEVELYI